MKIVKLMVMLAICGLAAIAFLPKSVSPPGAVNQVANPATRVGSAIEPAMRSYVEEAIRTAGYGCRSLNNLRVFGEGPRGTIFRAWCGPPGTTDVNTRLVYRVDVGQSGVIRRVSIWEGSPHSPPAR